MVEVMSTDREAQAQRNRELMPNVAALLDEIRQTFPGAKLIWGHDKVTGHSVGKQPQEDPDKTFPIPENYYPMRTPDLKVRKK